jgi:hypothetical protein
MVIDRGVLVFPLLEKYAELRRVDRLITMHGALFQKRKAQQ